MLRVHGSELSRAASSSRKPAGLSRRTIAQITLVKNPTKLSATSSCRREIHRTVARPRITFGRIAVGSSPLDSVPSESNMTAVARSSGELGPSTARAARIQLIASAGHVPEFTEYRDHLDRFFGAVAVDGGAKGFEQILVVGGHAGDPLQLLAPAHVRASLPQQPAEVRRMRLAEPVILTRGLQLL